MMNGVLISDDYRAQNAALHAKGDFGISGHKWAEQVEEIASTIRARTILDYGCGQQTLGKALSHRTIIPYDPCIPGLEGDPLPADLVVCGDVLEHIEPDCLDNVLDHLQTLTQQAIFLVVATRPAKKILPDGRNAHLIQETVNWWAPKLMARWTTLQLISSGREFMFVGSK